MNAIKGVLGLTGFLAALTLGPQGHITPAQACGGCFVPTETVSQVTGHRMILSLDNDQTTLYDQIEYAGDPESFAWVLPIKGEASVGLSSDYLFNLLDQSSQVTVQGPAISCGNQGLNANAADGNTVASSSAASGGGVTVISSEVVGPYETVQLKADDPEALATWLDGHGFQIPAEIEPIIADYVADEFNFLAMKLVPGQNVSAMRPVRITVPGAAPVLPLKMVAAGTGATTVLTLWVIAEGRYEPQNFPSFEVKQDALSWDFATGSSNYSQLRKDGYEANEGRGWLTEMAQQGNWGWLESEVMWALQYDAAHAGYGDGTVESATAEAEEDFAALFPRPTEAGLWLTRLRGELDRAALDADLNLVAAPQVPVSNWLQVASFTGDPCPGVDDSEDTYTVPSTCSLAPLDGPAEGLAYLAAILAAAAFATRRRR